HLKPLFGLNVYCQLTGKALVVLPVLRAVLLEVAHRPVSLRGFITSAGRDDMIVGDPSFSNVAAPICCRHELWFPLAIHPAFFNARPSIRVLAEDLAVFIVIRLIWISHIIIGVLSKGIPVGISTKFYILP